MALMREAKVHRIATQGPDDVSGLAAAIASGAISPAGILAILGKTEGNGCVNDFTRAFSVQSLKIELARHLPTAAVEEIAYVMSGGTEGALSPHILVLERTAGHPVHDRPSLAIGRALTPALPPEDLGRLAQVQMAAEGVRAAIRDAGIDDLGDVHFVQIKCPLLTSERIQRAEAEGYSTATRDTLKSMGLSRAASALGVAVALGELSLPDIDEAQIGRDMSLWSSRASTSAGVELENHEIVVLGMSRSWSGPLAVDHAVMADAIDVAPVKAAMDRLALGGEAASLVALLAKAEPGTSGRLRGSRHTMLDDSDISATRHARAFVGGVLAGLVGTAEIFVSGGAEHQGPDGGGPVAIIARRNGG
ncbi:ring-opening amidohydrolase [Rhizobium straminoryzae]|uniref:Cyanuric acid amidohydrolase n=2 Tax=Rhizobium straminoryzae TaxID=1387186 RepID=A0A549TBN7_9HYPH|nr:ring-opening amidohydrolase [Rhizobium straminoryzae]TRL39231.1 ring-opening amidohydrolase [Rhizobium straminoryzae]